MQESQERLRIEGRYFKDHHGRVILLRGVNLGGSSKIPSRPLQGTHSIEGFFEHRDVSFVGRPFPLEEADEHFQRLRAWGLTFLRWVVTWEAIEHQGPGLYDTEYLSFLEALVEKAGRYGFRVWIDPHQDVWGRLSGGDGAPGWTYEVAGFEPKGFQATGATFTHNENLWAYPRMIWPTNLYRLAAATMFTLFFGGSVFAPATRVEGRSIQDFLQDHYIRAWQEVAKRLRRFPHVVGYGTMNEPSLGWIGCPDIRKPFCRFSLGPSPTPLEAMQLGSGFPTEVELWRSRFFGPSKAGKIRIAPEEARAWRRGSGCVWAKNGVWGLDPQGSPIALAPSHFSAYQGRKVQPETDFLLPFCYRFAQAIRSIHPEAAIFLEGEPMSPPPRIEDRPLTGFVHAPHWYEASVLFLKYFSPHLTYDHRFHKIVFGRHQGTKMRQEQIAEIRTWATERLQDIPTVIGEFGVPFDMEGGKPMQKGDHRKATAALDAAFQALETNFLSATLWNYTADCTHRWGDSWNQEALSIFCLDERKDVTDIHSGGRGLSAVIRPYPQATAGKPLKLAFSSRERRFFYSFQADPQIAAPTEILIPAWVYPHGFRVAAPFGRFSFAEHSRILSYIPTEKRVVHTLTLEPPAMG